MIDVYNPFAKYNRPDDPWGGEPTGGSGSNEPPEQSGVILSSAPYNFILFLYRCLRLSFMLNRSYLSMIL